MNFKAQPRSNKINNIKLLIERAMSPLSVKFGFEITQILTNWSVIIGEELADKCLPVKISFPSNKKVDGILYLESNNASSAFEVQLKDKILINKLSTYFGYQAISKIKIKISSKTQDDNQNKGIVTKKTFKKEVLKKQELKGIISHVEDEELKHALQKLAGKCFFTGT